MQHLSSRCSSVCGGLFEQGAERLYRLALWERSFSGDETQRHMQLPVFDMSDNHVVWNMVCGEFRHDCDSHALLDGLLDDFEATNLKANCQWKSACHKGLLDSRAIGTGRIRE